MVARMREEGLYAEALSDWMADGERVAALLVGFTNIASRSMAESLGRRMLELL
jgi:GntR family transcriptional regulator/MocR family aminotransferase